MNAVRLPSLRHAEQLLAEVERQPRRYSSYENYKASHARWLSDVPQHWDLRRLKFVAKVNPTKSEINGLASEDAVSFVPMESIHEFGGMVLEETRPMEEVAQGYTYFRNGDTVIAKITPCFENGKGSIADGLTNGVGFGTTELHVVRPHKCQLDTRFLFYVTMSQPFRALGTGEMYGAGGQKRVPDSFVNDFRTPVPPLDEQQAIGQFLDRETAKIDSLVAKKRRLIELLGEKRTALISHAVTKGLNPDAPTKPSGIDWLGEVPQEWNVVRLKHFVQLLPGYAFASSGFTKRGDDIRLLRGVNIAPGRVVWDDEVRWDSDDASNYRHYELREGDIVFGMDRPWISSGIRVAQISASDTPCLLLQRVARLRATKALVQKYILALIESKQFSSYFAPILTGVSVPHISPGQILNYVFPLPSVDVQQEILNYIEKSTRHIATLTAQIEDAIARLNEYRSALISAAVTGQIDVRKEAVDA